ncbi:MAG: CinA family protein [Eubacteriales bacterium]|nr:CinA family protein [Eubacteriales bacterium]
MIELLLNHNLKISTAESCTGGLLASYITSFAGSSSVFDMGFVTYSNDAKNQLIGVNNDTLHSFGAVSKETALEMSKGVMDKAQSDIGVSITGIAGPDGGTKDKPVGLVYISLCSKFEHIYYQLNLDGDRTEIRHKTVEKAIEMVVNHVNKCYN